MARRDFQSIAELEGWLEASGIDLSAWGQGEAKQTADLWAEYVSGESWFQDKPPLRVVEVVQVIIRRGDAVLIEVAQELRDGRWRFRLRPPAEKLKQGEDPRAAAVRGLCEELGIAASEVYLEGGETTTEEIVVSTSYPGLPTHYTFYTFEATIGALPDEDFYRENIPGDPIRRHLWGWRLPEPDPDPHPATS